MIVSIGKKGMDRITTNICVVTAPRANMKNELEYGRVEFRGEDVPAKQTIHVSLNMKEVGTIMSVLKDRGYNLDALTRLGDEARADLASTEERGSYDELTACTKCPWTGRRSAVLGVDVCPQCREGSVRRGGRKA